MTVSRSSALRINVLLILDIHNLNVALFTNAKSFSALSFSFAGAAKDLLSFSQQYTHHYSHTNLILTLEF